MQTNVTPIPVRLTKLHSSHGHLRTDEVTGETLVLPQVGRPFAMSAPPLDHAADVRVVETTRVTSVHRLGPGSMYFRTANSVYRLDLLEHWFSL